MKYYAQIKNNRIIDFTTGPVLDSVKKYLIEIDTEEPINIGDTYIDGVITHNNNYPTFSKDKINYRKELNSILKWFADNDWKINKIVIGEWQQNDQRWQEYLTERAIKRARYDELILKITD